MTLGVGGSKQVIGGGLSSEVGVGVSKPVIGGGLSSKVWV